MIHGLFLRHPSLLRMLHNPEAGGQALLLTSKAPFAPLNDFFDRSAKNPADSFAETSSLWELHGIRQHYHPSCRESARTLETPITKRQTPQDVARLAEQTSYKSLFESHLNINHRTGIPLEIPLQKPLLTSESNSYSGWTL